MVSVWLFFVLSVSILLFSIFTNPNMNILDKLYPSWSSVIALRQAGFPYVRRAGTNSVFKNEYSTVCPCDYVVYVSC